MQRLGSTVISALAAVGRERENPRTERSEAAALKVQLGEVVRIRRHWAESFCSCSRQVDPADHGRNRPEKAERETRNAGLIAVEIGSDFRNS